MSYALAGQRCTMERVCALAGLPGVSTRSGPFGLAVRSGASSNDLNAVVSLRKFVPDRALLKELRGWWNGAPASWLVAEPDEALTRALVEADWTPDRTARWCGRPLGTDPSMPGAEPPRLGVVEVVSGADQLEQWLDVASDCGWLADPDDRARRRDLLRGAADDPRQATWLARVNGRPVGMARGWCKGPHVEVVDLAVRDTARRHGVGTALVSRVLTWGVAHGAKEVVAAPSPDGWRLFHALGFENVPAIPDTCFYLTG